jgi:hypothetical protein
MTWLKMFICLWFLWTCILTMYSIGEDGAKGLGIAFLESQFWFVVLFSFFGFMGGGVYLIWTVL